MTTSASVQPAALEWTIGYSPADISSITIAAGSAAINAGTTVACSGGVGSMTCLLYGLNSAPISNGVIAQIAVGLSSATTSLSTAIQLGGAMGASMAGAGIPATGSGGLITILQPKTTLSDLTCLPTTLAGPGLVSCAIRLSAAAPAAGSSVSVSASNSQVLVPASVPIQANLSQGSFTGTVASVTVAGTTMITASAGGITKSTAITFTPPQVSSLACSPAMVPSGNSTTCTVNLVSAAPAGGTKVLVSSGSAAITVPPSVMIAAGSTTAVFTANATGTLSQEVWVTATLNQSSAAALVTVGALQIQGDPSELSGSSNGAIITPKTGPRGFVGQLVIAGNGAVNFAPVEAGNGVSFRYCCSNTNTAHYKFKGVGLGDIFSVDRGQISFYLKSSYSFAQRQATAGSSRFAFDVQDNTATRHHLFYFLTEYVSNRLTFSYWLGGGNTQFYYVPSGSEDTLYGQGVTLQVTIAWDGSTSKLYLNGALAQSASYTKPVAAWTADSVFDLGATEYLTFGGYNSSDDLISGFTVGVPTQP
jgi:hypothetical protein